MNGMPITETKADLIKSVFLSPINSFLSTINQGVYLAAMGGD